MQYWLLISLALSSILSGKWLEAQQVRYSPFIDDSFTIAGKAGHYYWIERRANLRMSRHLARGATHAVFELYDERMHLIASTPAGPIPAATLKEYYVFGDEYFDQLLLIQQAGGVSLSLNRFSAAGQLVQMQQTIMGLEVDEPASSFLLVRSADRSKILLLVFQSVPSSGLNLHTVLFDMDWHILASRLYHHPAISQPCIQDDFISYPVDYFGSEPVKMTNSGEWLMACPSRESNDFLLFHFSSRDSSFTYQPIPLPSHCSFEDVALSVNDQTAEAFAGILSTFGYSAWKNVQVVHYSLQNHQFDFDSSYRFSTRVGYSVNQDNLTRERFETVPGAGFILLKEYGRPYSFGSAQDHLYDMLDLAASFGQDSLAASAPALLIHAKGYNRFNQLSGVRSSYDPGDLSVFYFPGRRQDSCWSGILHQEQQTDFHSANLSYLVVPLNQKIFFLYNSRYAFGNNLPQANSTILDCRGEELTDQGLIFWKMNNNLLIQVYLQTQESEVMLPYQNAKRSGFAVIRL
jgi:hypothetical protein